MTDSHVRYYILFGTYEEGLALHDILDGEEIPNRIAPAPRAIQGKLSCGMSLMLLPEHVEAAKACIARHEATYYAIVPLEGQLRSRRDQYC